MKNLFLILTVFLFFSCRNDENKSEVTTQISGRVFDFDRQIGIANYPIILYKNCAGCSNWGCGISSQKITKVYSDKNGYYSISFIYKDESVGNYNPCFYSLDTENNNSSGVKWDYASGNIKPNQNNFIDIKVWKPIKLKLNLNISNNYNPPLNISNSLENAMTNFDGIETNSNGYQTFYQTSKPNSKINLTFVYRKGANNEDYYKLIKVINTNTDEEQIINLDIDCNSIPKIN